jgi:hypothetical protein
VRWPPSPPSCPVGRAQLQHTCAAHPAEVQVSHGAYAGGRNTTCTKGQTGNICIFDDRIAILTGLTKSQLYYFRVMGGTIIGDGNASSVGTARLMYCQQCNAGKYKATPGADTCTSCPASSQSQAGSDSPQDCLCVAGYEVITYNETTSAPVCAACPLGKYKAEPGNFACTGAPDMAQGY